MPSGTVGLDSHRALEESERRYRELFEEAPVGIFSTSSDGKILSINPALAHMLGCTSVQEALGHFTDLGHQLYIWPEQREEFLRMLREQGTVKDFEYAARAKDGRQIWLSMNARISARNPDGSFQIEGFTTDITSRRMAEESSKRAGERFRALIERAPDGITMVNRDGEMTFVSPSARRMFGLEPDGPITVNPAQFTHPDDLPMVLTALDSLIQNPAEVPTLQYRFRHLEGPWLWVESTFSNLFTVPGVEAIVINFRNVTDRKQAEDALVASERKWRHVLVNTPQIGIGFDPEARIVFANAHFLSLTGWKENEVLGQNWFDMFIPAEKREELKTIFARVMSAKDILGFSTHENEILTRPGEVRDVAWSNVVTRDPSGAVIGVTCLGVDLTERRRAESTLRESEERWRSYVENAPYGVFIASEEGRYLQVNPEACRITGYSEAELVSMSVSDLMAPASREEGAQHFHRVVTMGHAHAEMQFIHKSGEVRWWSVAAVKLGKHRFLGFTSDETDRKKAEARIHQMNAELEQRVRERTAALEATNEELGAFSYSVSHDLRAPLRGIDGWSLALLEDYGDRLDGTGRQYLSRVRTEAQRMGRLIDDLIQLARISRSDLEFRPVDLSAIAHSVASHLRELEPQREVELTILPGLQGRGDPRLLEVVLCNLLGNAWKFTGGRPVARVEFGQRELNGHTAFFVHDNGAGFDMAHAQNLFGAFQRMHTASEFPGTGIGLATVQRIIHRHGGRVWAESKQGEETTIYLTLP